MTVATELATAAYFLGRWQMVRLIDDRAAGVFGEFWGEAVFEVAALPASDAPSGAARLVKADASPASEQAAAPQGQGQRDAPSGQGAAAQDPAAAVGHDSGHDAGVAASRDDALFGGGAGPAARDAAASAELAPAAPSGTAPRDPRGAAEPGTGAGPQAACAPGGPGDLACRESGVLRFGGRDFAAGRVTFWRFGPRGAIHVAHDDGRPFHSFHPAEAQALHLCGEDRYEVDYSFMPDVWTSLWRVSGPRKDYTMTTRYCRITGG
ncbi:DUF6314 family protein [Limibaculum sp. FT325]|uniref:DUF6314 family protein n=1 Tax=Thermohalobaculum sediminis TaxID=2939436 RepID=UPI0020BF0FC3|nr:DUF6314 family protein [Limibaculum sediminis]MCL5777357.1 DUF6314 family protein [Limibaculum sediminis]